MEIFSIQGIHSQSIILKKGKIIFISTRIVSIVIIIIQMLFSENDVKRLALTGLS